MDSRDETGLLILVVPHLFEMVRDYHYVEDRHKQVKEVPHRVEVLLSLLVKLYYFVAQSKDTENVEYEDQYEFGKADLLIFLVRVSDQLPIKNIGEGNKRSEVEHEREE